MRALLTGRVLLVATLLVASCHRANPQKPGALVQRGYLWQREWTPAVIDAALEADRRMDGLVVLAAEIVWENGAPRVVKPSISWEALRTLAKPCALALRIAPFPGPFATDDRPARAIVEAAHSILEEAKSHGFRPPEFQLDFDCAQKKLAGYRLWLRALRPAIHPAPLVITTLPAWLEEPEFAALARDTDGYVLQVHSVPTLAESGHAVLCDPALARKWVEKAAALGLPFSVALPTYQCLAGYGPSGKLLGLSMDSVQPAWPQGTQILEFSADADGVAGLVNEWQAARPRGLAELLWYRVPVATDARNWRWPTLSAVMAGRKPRHRLDASQQGGNPVDVAVVNNGEADEPLEGDVIVTWNNAALIAGDALPGWALRAEENRAVFTPLPGRRLRLAPGGKRDIGWLRYDRTISVEINRHEEPPR